MTKTKWYDAADRTTQGTFIPKADDPLGRSFSVRFPVKSVQPRMEAEAQSRGMSIAEFIRWCVVRELENISLSPQQQEIIKLLSDGEEYTTSAIAEAVGMSQNTASSQLNKLKTKDIIEKTEGGWKLNHY